MYIQLVILSKYFPHILGLVKKEQKVCLQSEAKKQDVMLLVSMMKDKVEELSNLGLKAFSIGTGDKEDFTKL